MSSSRSMHGRIRASSMQMHGKIQIMKDPWKHARNHTSCSIEVDQLIYGACMRTMEESKQSGSWPAALQAVVIKIQAVVEKQCSRVAGCDCNFAARSDSLVEQLVN